MIRMKKLKFLSLMIISCFRRVYLIVSILLIILRRCKLLKDISLRYTSFINKEVL